MAKFVSTKPTARRRRSGRSASAYLFELSANAYSLGKTAGRLYATARLSVTPRIMRGLSRAAAFYGISLSSAARRLLAIADSLGQGQTATAYKVMGYFEAKARNGTRPTKDRPRRKTRTAADIWAAANKGKYCHQEICLRLTARNLADIATQQAEAIEGGLIAKTFSKAFCSLLLIPLSSLENLIEAIECGIRNAIDPARRTKPTRTNRNRAYTEAKRRLLEAGTKADL